MTPTHYPGRTTIRVAAQVRAQLLEVSRPAWSIRPLEETWAHLVELEARLKLVLSRGWNKASQVVVEDLEYAIRRLQRELETFHGQLPAQTFPRRVSSLNEIAADLAMLPAEYSEVNLDLAERCISVVTDSIELEGVCLGRFRVCLHWDQLNRQPAFEVSALDPLPSAENQAVTHPHVYGELLCTGAGTLAIQAAQAEGRLFDFFALVNQILRTYNPGSAHATLNSWIGTICRDCGSILSGEDRGSCDRCDDPLCQECSHRCSHCDRDLCGGCAHMCADCDERFCIACLTDRNGSGRMVCRVCLEKLEKEADDPTDSTEADGAPSGPDPEATEEENALPCPAPL
jgi:hypothetical protein